MTITLAEVWAEEEKAPERAHILVWEDGEEFVCMFGAREYRSGNPFGLDSKLTDTGAPAPRNLYLVDRGELDRYPEGGS